MTAEPWSTRTDVHTLSPPPKGLRWLFLPTLFLGLGDTVHLATELWRARNTGETALWIAMLAVGEAFALFMVVAAVFVLSARLVVDFDTRARKIHLRSTSWIVSKTRTVAFEEVAAVELRVVRSAGNAHPINPVGTFAHVLLVNPATDLRAQVSSERLDTARERAERVAVLIGVPVTHA